MTREELRVVLSWFCGCGAPEAASRALLELLELHPLYEHQEAFQIRFPDDGVQYLLLYLLDHLDLTEHGGNVGGGWLSPKGFAVRDALRREVTDDFEVLQGPSCIHGYDIDDLRHRCD